MNGFNRYVFLRGKMLNEMQKKFTSLLINENPEWRKFPGNGKYVTPCNSTFERFYSMTFESMVCDKKSSFGCCPSGNLLMRCLQFCGIFNFPKICRLR